MAKKGKKYLFLTGSQAKRDLKAHHAVGGGKDAGAGMDLAGKLAASGKGAEAMKAAARVANIRKARKDGDKKAYKSLVLENRTARLNYNKPALGLGGGGYGTKNDGVTVGSKQRIKRLAKQGKISKKTQRGRIA